MKETFLKVTRQGHFFDKHTKVLVAVSGGKDSLALLHLLYDLQEELGVMLGIAHVNHCQRAASEQEEKYLKELARELALPFYVKRFTGQFTEENARDFRYAFFERIMEQEGYTALVTAHHADDQAETVLMRLIRGGRFLDMRGIQAVQSFGPGQLIRPFLSFTKAELPDVFHFEDESNSQPTYLRNRIRNTYLPLLEEENPKFKQALQALGQEAEIIRRALSDLTKDIPLGDTAVFQAQTQAVQEILLQQYLEQFPTIQLKKSQFQQVLSMLRSPKSYHTELKNGYVFSKTKERYGIELFSPQTDDILEPIYVEYGQTVSIGGMLFSFGEMIENADQTLLVEKDKPICIRTRQAGDSLFINGIHKKVRRYFIDNKIPQEVRKQALLIEQDGEIYGIAQMVASDLSKSDKHGIMKATLYIKK